MGSYGPPTVSPHRQVGKDSVWLQQLRRMVALRRPRLRQRQTAGRQRRQPQRRTDRTDPPRHHLAGQGRRRLRHRRLPHRLGRPHRCLPPRTPQCPLETHQQQRPGYWQTNVFFDHHGCTVCPVRSKCARSTTEPRKLALAPREEHEAIRARRRLQETDQWQPHYAARADVESTIAQGLRRCGLHRSRHIGLNKTRLQHVLTAAALNLIRTDAWLTITPLASTRIPRFSCLSPA